MLFYFIMCSPKWQDSAGRNKGKLNVVYPLDSISKSKTPGTRESLLYAERQFVSTGCYIFAMQKIMIRHFLAAYAATENDAQNFMRQIFAFIVVRESA